MKTRKKYKQIISLAPSITETLFAVGYGDKLVGRTEFCDWPEEAASIPIIGGFSSIDLQSILDRAPDMVIGTDLHKDLFEGLKNAGIHTALIPACPVYCAPSAIRNIGHAINAVTASAIVAQETEKGIVRIKQKALSLRPMSVCYLCNIACQAWYTCLVAKSVEVLYCALAGRRPSTAHNSDQVIDNIITDEPDVFVVPECQRCRKECINRLFAENAKLKEYLSIKKPRIVNSKSKLLARPGPRAAQALDELGLVIFDDLWKMEAA